MTNKELIKHIEILKDSAYIISLKKNWYGDHTILKDIKAESFIYVCNEMLKKLNNE